MRRILLALLCTVTISLQASSSEMINALSAIHGIFQSGYAPADWKKEYSGWDLDEEIDKAKQQVLDHPEMTVHEFQKIVADFFRSTHDYHVGVYFMSTERSQLGFEVRSAEGRYFIVHIDRSLLGDDVFPFEPGDELVTFDSRPVDEVVQELREEIGNHAGPEATEQALAEKALAQREWFRGCPCPQGHVLIGIRPQGKEKVDYRQLTWVYEEEQARMLPLNDQDPLKTMIDRKGIAAFYHPDPTQRSAGNRHEEGSRKSFLPNLGEITWKTKAWDTFDAYIYQNEEGHNIGYVRIPHYDARGSEWVAFAEIINRMEQQTDALIVDQVNNPGGVGFYCYALAAMLSDQPLELPRQKEKINQQNLIQAKQMIPLLQMIENDEQAKLVFSIYSDPDLPTTLYGFPINFQFTRGFLEYSKEIVREWDKGNRLTKPLHWFGVEKMNPSPFGRYTKPVLLLINELDFSCGDLLPAILQDSDRVTTMGTRTAGAGGYVLSGSFPNSLGIYAFSFTGSMGMRLSNDPIEDLGVTPEIPYTPTVNDLQSGYEDYAAAINEVIRSWFDEPEAEAEADEAE